MQAWWAILKAKIMNIQRGSKAYEIGKRHYDIGNDIFSIMLDKGMNYSCGYWSKAKTLDQAQTAKLEIICKKLGLKPGMKVLDIGCGWGGFAKYAAEGLFVLEDWHSFGQYYDKTLMTWYDNFTQNWDKIADRYDNKFYRMWTYYLLSCAGSFRARRNQLWQIVFSKKGIQGGYKIISLYDEIG